MLIRKEKYYEKNFKVLGIYRKQIRHRVSYLLFGIIPIYINDEHECGAINNSTDIDMKVN